MSILYRPDDAWAADFIPFFWNGEYHLFYLKDWRDVPGHGEGTPWWHLRTRDFVTFEDRGEALPRGPVGSQDRWVFTGSVIEREGVFHIFYVGHNQHFKGTGRPVQVIMHAVSRDLETWTKDGDFSFRAPTDRGYEPDDWRDPFVFWNDAAAEYWMLLAARKNAGPSRNRGCVALAASPDLKTWEVREPFWEPNLYYTHECPDLFKIGEWWYLIYSTFSERFVTHYRMSRKLEGPWLAPPNDTFDGRAYYAAKTAGDGERRYAFGWLPSREEENDTSGWQWGGELVVHEIVQRSDGTLAVRMPEAVRAAFTEAVVRRTVPILGRWKADGEVFSADALGRRSVISLGALPASCRIETTISFERGTYGFGLLLRTDDALDGYYELRVEPANRRLVFDRWPRPGDQSFMVERRFEADPEKPIHLSVILDGTCLVAYADDEVALSCRMYDHREGGLGLFVAEGKARFEGVAVLTR